MPIDEGDLSAYEGLILRTSVMFAPVIGIEVEDMRQELRVRVWMARKKYDPTRSRCPERKFVFGCVANFVRDMKKQSVRRQARSADAVAVYIEDSDYFEGRYSHATHEEIYGVIEQDGFRLPNTLTSEEARVLLFLMFDFSQVETARALGLRPWRVQATVTALREKLADWAPSSPERAAIAA